MQKKIIVGVERGDTYAWLTAGFPNKNITRTCARKGNFLGAIPLSLKFVGDLYHLLVIDVKYVCQIYYFEWFCTKIKPPVSNIISIKVSIE